MNKNNLFGKISKLTIAYTRRKETPDLHESVSAYRKHRPFLPGVRRFPIAWTDASPQSGKGPATDPTR
jgi:hypothetical protein